jgi:hypothetical protein
MRNTRQYRVRTRAASTQCHFMTQYQTDICQHRAPHRSQTSLSPGNRAHSHPKRCAAGDWSTPRSKDAECSDGDDEAGGVDAGNNKARVRRFFVFRSCLDLTMVLPLAQVAAWAHHRHREGCRADAVPPHGQETSAGRALLYGAPTLPQTRPRCFSAQMCPCGECPLVWLRVSQFDTCVNTGASSGFRSGIA